MATTKKIKKSEGPGVQEHHDSHKRGVADSSRPGLGESPKAELEAEESLTSYVDHSAVRQLLELAGARSIKGTRGEAPRQEPVAVAESESRPDQPTEEPVPVPRSKKKMPGIVSGPRKVRGKSSGAGERKAGVSGSQPETRPPQQTKEATEVREYSPEVSRLQNEIQDMISERVGDDRVAEFVSRVKEAVEASMRSGRTEEAAYKRIKEIIEGNKFPGLGAPTVPRIVQDEPMEVPPISRDVGSRKADIEPLQNDPFRKQT